MMLGSILVLAWRETRRHLLRSFLTTLGIIIGVAAVVTMVTLGNGVTASIKERISALGSNVLIIFAVNGDRGNPRSFNAENVERLYQIAGVRKAAGKVTTNVTAIINGQNWTTTLDGANGDLLLAQNIGLAAGRPFTAQEEGAGASVCLIGSKVRHNLSLKEAIRSASRCASTPPPARSSGSFNIAATVVAGRIKTMS